MAIKKADKERKHTSRELKDHVVSEVKIEDDAGTIDNEHKGVQWEATEGEVHSSTQLEDDEGFGEQAIIRAFDFYHNPGEFKKRVPTKQELFNSHVREIEIALFESGLEVMPDVNPQLILSKNKDGYRIMVGARPMKSHLVTWGNKADQFKTLSQIANDTGANPDKLH